LPKLCVMLHNKSEPVDADEPSTIRKWVWWPVTPRVGERCLFLDDVIEFEELENLQVTQISHEMIRRNLSQLLRGVPRQVTMLHFEVEDHLLLLALLNFGTGWKRKQ